MGLLKKRLDIVTGERDDTLGDYEKGYREMEALRDQVFIPVFKKSVEPNFPFSCFSC